MTTMHCTVWTAASNDVVQLYVPLGHLDSVECSTIRRGRVPFEVHKFVCNTLELDPGEWDLAMQFRPLDKDARDTAHVIIIVMRNLRSEEIMTYNCRWHW